MKPMKYQHAIQNPPVLAAMRTALESQIALFAAIATLENLTDHPAGDTIQDALMEFVIGIDDTISDETVVRAVAWICYGKEDAA
jgi:hypothetical protein